MEQFTQIQNDIETNTNLDNFQKENEVNRYRKFKEVLYKENKPYATTVTLRGHLYLICGFSGSGKNSLIQKVLNNHTEMHYLKSTTTRAMRTYETQNPPYDFVSKETFLNGMENGDYLEYENIHGNYYGTSNQKILTALTEGKILITDCGVEGCLQIKNSFTCNVTLLFITPSKTAIESELYKRLISRGDTLNDIELRLARLYYESLFLNTFDGLLLNDEGLDELYHEFKQFML